MRKIHMACLLVSATVLIGAGHDEFAAKLSALLVSNLPACTDTQYLVYDKAGSLACRELVGAAPDVPDCAKSGQLLTHTGDSGTGGYGCVAPGTESLDAQDITLINQTLTRLLAANVAIADLEGTASTPPRSVQFCGLYAVAANPNGAITGNGVTGAAGAANLCSSLPACGAGARMCTVYDMYNSVAMGAITTSTVLQQAWVHMAAWQHNSAMQVPPSSGLGDNCAGWTYSLDDKFWYGTTVEWKDAPSGARALHFASGPGVVACSRRFPIACCK